MKRLLLIVSVEMKEPQTGASKSLVQRWHMLRHLGVSVCSKSLLGLSDLRFPGKKGCRHGRLQSQDS